MSAIAERWKQIEQVAMAKGTKIYLADEAMFYAGISTCLNLLLIHEVDPRELDRELQQWAEEVPAREKAARALRPH